LDSGFKFRFDPQFQRLDQIEIFIDVRKIENKKSKGLGLPPDILLGGNGNDEQACSIWSSLSYSDINSRLGGTGPASTRGDMAQLSYPGIKFLFKYELPHGIQ
jgi:hypothetical protein